MIGLGRSMSAMIRWIERAPELHEARATLPDGRERYVGYVAMTPGAAVWRGYVGQGFEPVGMGPLGVMRRAVEQHALEALGQSDKGVVGGASGGQLV